MLQQMDDGSLQYTTHVGIDGATDRLLLILLSFQDSNQIIDPMDGEPSCTLQNTLMQHRFAMTEEQAKRSITIDIE